jgi:hypothetical protein
MSKQSKSGQKDRHTGDPFCVFCESKGHWAQECKKVTEVSDRREKLKSAHCFLCLNRGHNARVCSKRGRASCTRCKGEHHRSICNETGAITTPIKDTAPTTVGKIDVAPTGFTYLQTARIWVIRPTGLSKLTRCFGRRQSVKFCRYDLNRRSEIRRGWSPELGGKCIRVTVLWLMPMQSCASAQRAHGQTPSYLLLPLKVLTPYALTPQSLMTSPLWCRLANYN